jgi:hypothetical protein
MAHKRERPLGLRSQGDFEKGGDRGLDPLRVFAVLLLREDR